MHFLRLGTGVATAAGVALLVVAGGLGSGAHAQSGRSDLIMIPGGNDPGTWHVVNSGISDTIRPIYYNSSSPCCS